MREICSGHEWVWLYMEMEDGWWRKFLQKRVLIHFYIHFYFTVSLQFKSHGQYWILVQYKFEATGSRNIMDMQYQWTSWKFHSNAQHSWCRQAMMDNDTFIQWSNSNRAEDTRYPFHVSISNILAAIGCATLPTHAVKYPPVNRGLLDLPMVVDMYKV